MRSDAGNRSSTQCAIQITLYAEGNAKHQSIATLQRYQAFNEKDEQYRRSYNFK